jgi:4-amino-4-deoxy-L-arabinose transferase-like glycosyltransferase
LEDRGRHSGDARWLHGAVAAILLTAAALRFWALGHGIPFATGVDEPEVMDRVLRMMKTGDFNPHFFDYPTLYFYLLLPVTSLSFLVGAVGGQWTSLDQVAATDFYLWARALTAAMGTATVWLTYRVGRRFDVTTALLAMALMAVVPLHVRESHYVLTDVPMTACVALTWLLTLRAVEAPRALTFALAGVAAGAAMATKYTAVLALTMPWLASLSMPGVAAAQRVAWAATSAAAAGLTFLVAAPYTVLDLPAFLNGFAKLSTSYLPREAMAEPGWLTYAKHLRRALGWPGTLATAVGLGLACARGLRGPDRPRWLLAAVTPLVVFWFIQGRGLVFGRYLLPALPFVSVLSAVGLTWLLGRLSRVGGAPWARPAATAALVGVVLAGPALQAVAFNRMIAGDSTQALAYAWIRANVRPDELVILEKQDLRLPPTHFRSAHVDRLIRRSLGQHQEAGARYLVASSQAFGPVLADPRGGGDAGERYRELFATTREVFRATPSAGRTGPELRILRLDAP